MDRRTVLKLAAAGVLPGANGLLQIACTPDGYRPEFFSRSQFALLDNLSDLILPADEHSPGASAAGVSRYIDVVVADAPTATQELWQSGLEAFAGIARQRFGSDFGDCDAGQQGAILADLATAEGDPNSAAERFFVLVKQATIDGYYTSEVGIRDELRYAGNTAVDEFAGCTHAEHG